MLMDTLAEVKRGEEADRLLSNPLLVEALDKVKTGILRSMQDSAFGDERTHHHLVIALQITSQIEKALRDVAATGKMAKIQFEQGMTDKLRKVVGF